MIEKNYRFALALNQENQFVNGHFGDADKYMLVRYQEQKLIPDGEVNNIFKDYDSIGNHGDRAKGEAIAQMLQDLDVRVLVSTQFGINVRVVSKYFIPIVVGNLPVNEVLTSIYKHRQWVEDEMQRDTNAYKLFVMKNGMLKTKAIETD